MQFTVALGSRTRFNLGKTPVLLRLQLSNLFNEYGWLVTSSGAFSYSPQRSLLAQLTVDL